MSKIPNIIKKKVLLLLALGVELGFNPSPIGHIRAWKMFSREWKDINKKALKNAVRELHRKKFVEFKKNRDGTVSVLATETGKNKATHYKVADFAINKPNKWDQKWRAVIFDIPEEKRKARDIFRSKIKGVGFYELQKSVWIYPYDCEDVINFVADFYNIKDHARYILIDKITNDEKIKFYFGL